MVRLILTWFLLFSLSVMADGEGQADIQLIALFKNAAMIKYEGKQKLYRAGQEIGPGVKLIKADTQLAVISFDGKPVEFSLNRESGFGAFPDEEGAVKRESVTRIYRDLDGMYKTPGSINGKLVQFLVDTGSTLVAMNETVATQLGLPYQLYGEKSGVSTANGNAPAWRIQLDRVKVGDIELKNVQGLVIKGTGPNEVLLGMSFLNRLKVENEGNRMILTRKF